MCLDNITGEREREFPFYFIEILWPMMSTTMVEPREMILLGISQKKKKKVLCHICGRRNNEEFFIFGREKVQMAHSLLFIR